MHSLLFPAACVGCHSPVEGDLPWPLCPGCLAKLPSWQAPWCARCGRSLAHLGAGVELCLTCEAKRYAFDQAVSCFPYEGAIQELVLAFKYQGETSLFRPLSQRMAQTVRERIGNDPADWVVPVPLHPVRLRERGFNQAELLAKGLADGLSLPCTSEVLARTKATLPQAQLTRRQRAQNVRQAFSLKPSPWLGEARILLVDDVFTTGATVHACAALLKQAGALQVTVVTFAHG